jgi:hypothetical protein
MKIRWKMKQMKTIIRIVLEEIRKRKSKTQIKTKAKREK